MLEKCLGISINLNFNCCRITAYDDQLGCSASLSYDDFARLTSHTDNQGNTLAYEYDGMNRVTKVTDHTSTDTTYAYDLAGRVGTLAYDPTCANRQTAYTYDDNSNAATVTYSNSYTSTFTYDNINPAERGTEAAEYGGCDACRWGLPALTAQGVRAESPYLQPSWR